MTTTSPADLYQRIRAGDHPLLLDVRSPREFARVHVPGAVLLPLNRLEPAAVAKRWPKADEPLFVLCHSGARARRAISMLQAAGLQQCVLVEGGTQAWIEAGLPVERQEVGGISIECQVRIVAGALVFAGTLLGAFWSRGFLAIPGFVGAGLVFAGITDICGMGMLLARMPWNQ